MARLARALRRAIRADHHNRPRRVHRGDRSRRERPPTRRRSDRSGVAGITVVACLWWAYFDWFVYVAHATLSQATGAQRAALARDAYSYLHLPMVGGIVLSAFAPKTTLPDVTASLPLVPAVALVGGIALYLLAHVALRLRIGGIALGRPIASALVLGLLPVVSEVPGLAALGLVAAVCVSLIGYEVLRHREARAVGVLLTAMRHAYPQPARGVHQGRGRPYRSKPSERSPPPRNVKHESASPGRCRAAISQVSRPTRPAPRRRSMEAAQPRRPSRPSWLAGSGRPASGSRAPPCK
jgi:hypothetical protein